MCNPKTEINNFYHDINKTPYYVSHVSYVKVAEGNLCIF
jgi:hypothetical protein